MSFEEMELPEEGLNEMEGNMEQPEEQAVESTPGKFDKLLGEHSRKFKLSGMFKDWFLDYSSYVILYRDVCFMLCTKKIQEPTQRWRLLSVLPWSIILMEIHPS